MITLVTKEQRDKERKNHDRITYCINCYSCMRPCGKTTVARYRKYLKETDQDDPWDVDVVVLPGEGQSVQRDTPSTDGPDPRKEEGGD